MNAYILANDIPWVKSIWALQIATPSKIFYLLFLRDCMNLYVLLDYSYIMTIKNFIEIIF